MTDFENIYSTYFHDVFLYIRRLSGDTHMAEEVTSETFLKAMGSVEKFRGECDIRVWLCQIAKNCYYDHLTVSGADMDGFLNIHNKEWRERLLAILAECEGVPASK